MSFVKNSTTPQATIYATHHSRCSSCRRSFTSILSVRLRQAVETAVPDSYSVFNFQVTSMKPNVKVARELPVYHLRRPSNKARNKVSHEISSEIYEIDWSRVRGHEIGCTRWVESEVNTEIAAVSVK